MGDLPTGAASVVGVGGVDVLEGAGEGEFPEDVVLAVGISGCAEGKDKGGEPVVRALVQLLAMTRADYLKTAQEQASGGENAIFKLGGAQAIEDMLAETLKLIDGQVSDDVKIYFPES